MELPSSSAPTMHGPWGVDLDLLDLPCMPSGRKEFFHRVRRLNRESWRWTPAQKRAFNKIWGHLEQLELHQAEQMAQQPLSHRQNLKQM